MRPEEHLVGERDDRQEEMGREREEERDIQPKRQMNSTEEQG